MSNEYLDWFASTLPDDFAMYWTPIPFDDGVSILIFPRWSGEELLLRVRLRADNVVVVTEDGFTTGIPFKVFAHWLRWKVAGVAW